MREQELKLAKVKRSCKTAKTVTSVFGILLVVATVLCIIGAVICYTFRGQINEAIASQTSAVITYTNLHTNGILNFSFDVDKLAQSGLYAQLFAIYCSFGAACTAVTSLILLSIRKIFVVIEKSESPFTEDIMKRMKKTFIGLAIVTGLFVGVGPCLFVALIFWCIYCIMDYGTAIQTEIDETL